MWQIYIYDEEGNQKPYLKPWKEFEKAEKFAEMVLVTGYEIKRVNS